MSANALCGPVLGVACFQWALRSTPAGIVQPIVAELVGGHGAQVEAGEGEVEVAIAIDIALQRQHRNRLFAEALLVEASEDGLMHV